MANLSTSSQSLLRLVGINKNSLNSELHDAFDAVRIKAQVLEEERNWSHFPRTDLTDQLSFCIDGSTAMVHDDAIMFRPSTNTDSQGDLYVLITNAARLFDSRTFREDYVPRMNSKPETIYSPSAGASWMLPQKIIETGIAGFQCMKLNETLEEVMERKKLRDVPAKKHFLRQQAICFKLHFGESGLDVYKSGIELAEIKPPYSVTYSECDEILGKKDRGIDVGFIRKNLAKMLAHLRDELLKNHRVDYQRKMRRAEWQGNVTFSEVGGKLTATPNIRTKIEDYVEFAMAATNTLAAFYAQFEKDIPMIFATREKGYGVEDEIYPRSNLSVPYRFKTTKSHGYARVTSPARRYIDLRNTEMLYTFLRYRYNRLACEIRLREGAKDLSRVISGSRKFRGQLDAFKALSHEELTRRFIAGRIREDVNNGLQWYNGREYRVYIRSAWVFDEKEGDKNLVIGEVILAEFNCSLKCFLGTDDETWYDQVEGHWGPLREPLERKNMRFEPVKCNPAYVYRPAFRLRNEIQCENVAKKSKLEDEERPAKRIKTSHSLSSLKEKREF